MTEIEQTIIEILFVGVAYFWVGLLINVFYQGDGGKGMTPEEFYQSIIDGLPVIITWPLVVAFFAVKLLLLTFVIIPYRFCRNSVIEWHVRYLLKNHSGISLPRRTIDESR